MSDSLTIIWQGHPYELRDIEVRFYKQSFKSPGPSEVTFQFGANEPLARELITRWKGAD